MQNKGLLGPDRPSQSLPAPAETPVEGGRRWKPPTFIQAFHERLTAAGWKMRVIGNKPFYAQSGRGPWYDMARAVIRLREEEGRAGKPVE